ncbi:hypothetical protein OPIT5_10995 [Opitutaceae bacterium TAV5]|nr:hypothetical protein OPIT5_10995 [Opitutaceae bacterium TAV5]
MIYPIIRFALALSGRALLLVSVACPALSAGTPASIPLVSGEPLPVGTPDRRGPLSLGLSHQPCAAVRLSGGARPDILVSAGNWSRNPGLYFLRYSGEDPSGAPVFADPLRIPTPGTGKMTPANAFWQEKGGPIRAFWIINGKIHRTVLNPQTLGFEPTAPPLELTGLPRAPGAIAVHAWDNGRVDIVLAVGNGESQHPADKIDWRSPDYRPYDGAFISRGGQPAQALYQTSLASHEAPAAEPARKLFDAPYEVRFFFGGLTFATFEEDTPESTALVGGTVYGNIHVYRNTDPASLSLAPSVLAVTPDGIALRTPVFNAPPLAYPSSDGFASDLIIGGEGSLSYLRYTGRKAASGAPIYARSVPVLQENALLYSGSLPVINVADWDGDGALDIVSGNSEGRVLFFKNLGDSRNPAFANGVEIEEDGEPIHIQQGYVAVQGPIEQRWGYTSPRVFDWDGDGLLDIVMSSALSRHEVYFNRGTPQEPRLGRARRLYSEGIDVHGTWRVQPAVARIGDRVAYVILDTQNELHLYWQLDPRNLVDAGKLLLDNGSPINAGYQQAGGTGRLKLQLVDWDLDGRLDLLIGTHRWSSVPNPQTGFPRALSHKDAVVLFLKNVGTDEKPVYAFPKPLKFQGRVIYQDSHICTPYATALGAPGGPNLLVGDQGGCIYYYARKDLSWD